MPLTSLFNLFYTCESACLFSVGDATKVVWSREGVRMGCPLGSVGFDLALQAVLEQASQRKGLHVVRAITDDAAIAVRLTRYQTASRACHEGDALFEISYVAIISRVAD
jgi:hypothetical protein